MHASRLQTSRESRNANLRTKVLPGGGLGIARSCTKYCHESHSVLPASAFIDHPQKKLITGGIITRGLQEVMLRADNKTMTELPKATLKCSMLRTEVQKATESGLHAMMDSKCLTHV